MRPDGSAVRRYAINVDENITLVVRERLGTRGEHSCVVRTKVNGPTCLVTRLVVDADGRVVFGPEEMYRAPGFDGGWLSVSFTLDDLVALLRY